jgi:type IV secretion system protein VirB9
MKRGAKMRKKSMYVGFVLLLTVLWPALFAFPREASSEEAVLLPSRLEEKDGAAPIDDESKMVEEWLLATGAAPVGEGVSVSPYMVNRTRRDFLFGVVRPAIVCRTGMITDIELEPGERVENFSISDGPRWSISAAWNGDPNNLVTHILLRPFFPGLKASLSIYTDRRTYSIDLSSSLDGLHMAYVGFKYTSDALSGEEPISPGRYRDLLVKYGIIEGGEDGKIAEPKRVDGTDLDFGYSIKPLASRRGKISWAPKSVYDAGGWTYFVMPDTAKNGVGEFALFVMKRGELVPMPLKMAKNGLLATDIVFDEALLKLGAEEVSIVRSKLHNQ